MSPDRGLLEAMRTIVAGDKATFARALAAQPKLATTALEVGASRARAATYFFATIAHYVYAGDTALHVAAAARQLAMATLLLEAGANVHAKNRRGAEALHYAVDGGPGNAVWEPAAQVAMIEALLAAGADPNATDKGGVTPLHRAVRKQAEILRLLSAR